MNKLIRLGVVLLTATVLSACTSFRVNMTRGFSANSPAKPAKPIFTHEWVDVAKWQEYLISKHFLAAGSFRLNEFDAATELATKKFQKWPGTGSESAELPQTGCVNFATYAKATREGLPKFKQVVAEPCHTLVKVKGARAVALGSNGNVGTMGGIGGGADFRIVMKIDCTHPSVKIWQQCLCCLGYMNTASGTFDNTTVLKTKTFQGDVKLTRTGSVDQATFNKADALCDMDVRIVLQDCPPPPPNVQK